MLTFNWICGTIALAYLLGSIPFGLILTRMAGLGDIRKVGSGNIGATNVMRTGHKMLAVFTLLLDALKGYVAVLLANYIYSPEFALLAAFAAVLGHVFPVWLKYKGGKGVATTLGALLGLDPLLGATTCFLWVMIFLLTRISSLSALLSIGFSSLAAYLIAGESVSALCMALAAFMVYTHRANIQRLMDGTEHHFRSKAH